jgi:cation:H+ antiporter
MITSLTLLILSLVALYIGAGWLVQGSSALALKAKISPLVVGLTIVAFGTSAPELVVSLNATLSGQGDIAIGNIVGSNIFNIGVILGVSATICPLQVKKQLLRIDIPVMLAATVLFTILFWNGTLGRTEGLFFLTGIIIYTIFSLFYSRKHGTEGSSQELEEQPKHWAVDTLAIVGGRLGICLSIIGGQCRFHRQRAWCERSSYRAYDRRSRNKYAGTGNIHCCRLQA